MRDLIVDASVAGMVFSGHEDFLPVVHALWDGKPKPWRLVHGGKLSEELASVRGVSRSLLKLESAGKARKVRNAEIEQEMAALQDTPLKSNDRHVLALARCSGARLLCTHDGELSQDFTNRDIINSPRGKVYKDASHVHLLKY